MSSDAVEQIKNRLSIVDIVAPYVELHPAGKNMKGKSPFTNERTPSFFVSPERGMYYCFSTSQGGDMFNFVQHMEGVDFKGALKILAEKAGVELVKEDPKKITERDKLFSVLEEVTKFFGESLTTKKEAVKYLKDRGVTDSTITKWRIGYAPDDWRAAATHLKALGFSDEILRKAGLVKGDAGKDSYDVFRDRVMFPICDSSGRVVGFSGRILSKDSEAPKYVNSPDTDLFNKSEILFGYDKAKQFIRSMNFSLIVEGQFDVVMSHQAGYTNTVAVSGTALTPQHISLLQRLSNRVVLALDADKAGIAAVKRAATLMLGRGLDIKVAMLPNGEDPADLVKKGTGEYKKAIGQALPVIEFLLLHIKNQNLPERNYKLTVRDEVLPFVAKVQSPVDREYFEQKAAEYMGVAAESVRLEVARILEKDAQTTTKPRTAVNEDKKILINNERLPVVTTYIVAIHEVVQNHHASVVERVVSNISNQTWQEFSDQITAEEISRYVFELENDFKDLDDTKVLKKLAEKLEEWRELYLRRLRKDLHQKLVLAEKEKKESEVGELMRNIQEINNKLTKYTITIEDLTDTV